MATLPPLPPGAQLVENPTEHLPPLPFGAQLVQEAQKKGMDIFPNWLQDVVKYGPGFLKETRNIVGRGAGTMLADMAEGAGNLAGEGMRSPNITASQKPQQAIAAALPDTLSNSPEDQRFRRMAEGFGAGLAMPVPGAVITSGVAGAGGGLGGALGRQAGENFFPKSPGVQTGMDIGGSVLGAGFTGLALGPKQSVGQQDIRRALTGTTPAQFDQAAANAAQAQALGAKTATGVEMFPRDSGIMALGRTTRGSASDNPLLMQTTGRAGDLKDLADEFLNRIKPAGAGPNTVATGINRSADALSESVKDARSAAMNAPLQGVFIDPSKVNGIVQVLKTSKALNERTGVKDAYQTLIDEMAPGGKPIQNLSELSKAITEAKPRLGNPNDLSGGAQQISPNDMRYAIQHTRELLAQVSPEFEKGFNAYKSQSKAVVEPFQSSALDKLTSTNPYNPSEGRIGQISQVFGGSNPNEVRGIAADLAQAPGAPTSPLDIARALAEQKLGKVGRETPADIGTLVRGGAGSTEEQKLAALLDLGGKDPAHTLSPLAMGDRLQGFAGDPNLHPPTAMAKLQMMIRPLRTLDMMTTGMGINKTNAEIGALLADRSPEGIRKLQEIGMFNPAVRRALTARAALAPLDQENK